MLHKEEALQRKQIELREKEIGMKEKEKAEANPEYRTEKWVTHQEDYEFQVTCMDASDPSDLPKR